MSLSAKSFSALSGIDWIIDYDPNVLLLTAQW